ncbi:hypothetical protein RLEG12_08160 (plasmid) [Rhizobium leguminosarum bv. trifolii CB782]|nr:hypothetical protein RLEG12_08160 [Rhizobium leguminosarum bv. trifolii CB782]
MIIAFLRPLMHRIPLVPIEAAGIGFSNMCAARIEMHSRSGGKDYMATWIYVTNEFDRYFNTIFLMFATVVDGTSRFISMQQYCSYSAFNRVCFLVLVLPS